MLTEKQFLQKLKEAEEETEKLKKDKKSGPPPEDGESWLVSYADMMTLLCGFFIMLYSMSKVDTPKYEKAQKAVAEHFGQEFKSATTEMAQFITQVVHEMGDTISNQIGIKVEADGVNIIAQSSLLFETANSDISPEGRIILANLVSKIAELQEREEKEFKIAIEGHTDSIPMTSGEIPSNWDLSSIRASKVVRLFLDQGFSPQKLTSIGYGDSRPEFPPRLPSGEWDEVSLKKNRRVVIRVLPTHAEAIPFASDPAWTQNKKTKPSKENSAQN